MKSAAATRRATEATAARVGPGSRTPFHSPLGGVKRAPSSSAVKFKSDNRQPRVVDDVKNSGRPSRLPVHSRHRPDYKPTAVAPTWKIRRPHHHHSTAYSSRIPISTTRLPRESPAEVTSPLSLSSMPSDDDDWTTSRSTSGSGSEASNNNALNRVRLLRPTGSQCSLSVCESSNNSINDVDQSSTINGKLLPPDDVSDRPNRDDHMTSKVRHLADQVKQLDADLPGHQLRSSQPISEVNRLQAATSCGARPKTTTECRTVKYGGNDRKQSSSGEQFATRLSRQQQTINGDATTTIRRLDVARQCRSATPSASADSHPLSSDDNVTKRPPRRPVIGGRTVPRSHVVSGCNVVGPTKSKTAATGIKPATTRTTAQTSLRSSSSVVLDTSRKKKKVPTATLR